MDISERLEREKSIKKEMNKIKKLYKDFKPDEKKFLEGLISEAAFMKVSLEETRVNLIQNGLTEELKQGSQCFTVERKQVSVYMKLMKQYTTTMKQLIDLLHPGEDKTKAKSELAAFIQKGNAIRSGAKKK